MSEQIKLDREFKEQFIDEVFVKNLSKTVMQCDVTDDHTKRAMEVLCYNILGTIDQSNPTVGSEYNYAIVPIDTSEKEMIVPISFSNQTYDPEYVADVVYDHSISNTSFGYGLSDLFTGVASRDDIWSQMTR